MQRPTASRRQMLATTALGTTALLGYRSSGGSTVATLVEEYNNWLTISAGETHTLSSGTNTQVEGMTFEDTGALVFEPDASLGFVTGDSDDDVEETTVVAETHDVYAVGESSATIVGELSDLTGYDDADGYFEFRESGDSFWNNSSVQTLESTGTFEDELTDLRPDTGYEFRAVVDAGDESDTGEILTFKTSEEETAVSVETVDATDIDESTAILVGDLSELTGYDDAECYFAYRENGDDIWIETTVQTLSTTETYDQKVTGLTGGTEYVFKALADGEEESSSGQELRFETEEDTEDAEDAAPVIEQFNVEDRSNPVWSRYDVDWTVSHEDGNLDTAITALLYNGTTVATESTNISGEEASFSHSLRVRGDVDEIRFSVNDTENQVTNETKSV